MKMTKDVEIEVMRVHNLFWESYARRDIELRFSLCSEDVTFIGSGLHERATNKTEYKIINQEGVNQFPDPFQIEFVWTNLNMLNENVACIESEVIWSQLINDEMTKELLRNTTLLKRDNEKWLVTHVHGSVPDYRLKDGDYMTNEQTIIRNRELERQVFERTRDLNKTLEELEQKNRELEIEGSLEKVRTIAMGMRKPADMLDVCKTISFQLQSLGVKEIRNVQTAIFYEQRGTYMNYEFYAKHDKTFITETVFTNNEIHNEFATKMLRGKGETFITHIKGDEVKDWIAYQKTTNVFIDKYLETASSLNYYWFSLGPVALGISTYVPLTEDEINLFKRFLKVFELAYQRYLDIEKAEAQAREAQIEASLERVRAVAMGMNKSDDLLSICEVSFKEFKKLGFDNIRNALIHIQYDEKKYFMDYDFSALTGGAITKIEYGSHPIVVDYLEQIRSAKDAFYQGVIKEDQLEEWKDFRRSSGQIDDPRLDKATALYYYFFSIGIGDIGISTLKPIDESQIKILKRFRNVFDLAYRRFNDIALAEQQARETQIQLALERVRAKTMAMQKSVELKDVIRVVYEQFVHLKINVDHAGFVVDYTPKGDWHFWIADEHDIPSKITHPYFESVWANQFNEAKEKGADFFATNLNFEEKNKFYNELLTYVPGLPEASKDFYLSCPALAATTVLFDNVSLYIENFSGIPYTDEENNMLMRFGKVFQQTYTRFLDLQKAEAQARESQIEASLERVRSKALAMHSPNDLSETVNVFFKELKILGIIPIRCGVGQIDKATRTTNLTTTTSSQQGDSFQVIGKVKQTGHPVLDGIFDHWELQKEYHPVLEGDDIKAYYNVMNAQIGYPEYPEGVTQYGNSFFFKEGFVFAWTENLLSEEELIIFRRFTLVLSLTYRRYLDLKEAEERNKIIQAENDRKTNELEEARQLQLSMLPKKLPQLPNLDIAVYMKTATEVGGDYYDFNVDGNGILTFVVGDATGHGMMSGMMVSIMKSFFISSKANIELKRFFENSNNSIKDMQLGRLMMGLIGIQITTEKIIATNAGMPSLLYFRNKSQKAGEFVSNNLPLGGMKGTQYLLKEINYEKGDTLLLMSDGFAELKNSQSEQYGYTRAKEQFRSISHKSANEIIEELKNTALQWLNGAEPDDDVTFVVIKVK
jgi:hypothetical protein